MNTDKTERVSSQVMELKELIAGPLLATIDADSISSMRYLEFLYKIAFESYDSATGKTGALRMLTFSYACRDLTGRRQQTVSIPLLTLVPLPLLQVHEADFDFDIQVLDAFSRQKQSMFSFTEGKVIDDSATAEGNDTRLRVALASSSGGNTSTSEARQSNLNANMKVHIKMRQADMPGGLSAMLSKAVNNMASDVCLPDSDERLNKQEH